MASQKYHFYQGIILNPKTDLKCDFFNSGILVVNNGKIKDLLNQKEALKKYGHAMTKKNTIDFGHALILPGFFDMHFHWVQDDVRMMPKDSLLEWLEKFTFPTEAKFANKSYAQKKAKAFFKQLFRAGTLGGACYSSIHEGALVAAMNQVKGEFVIGNVLMNMNSPNDLMQSEMKALELTKKLIKKFKTRHCFTPRFAITTTPRVMREGSALADKAKCFKQTHLSETPAEIDFVLSLYKKIPGFEKVTSYTEIYEKSGMLGKRSLMGHGIHLSNRELAILKKTQTSLIHCPTSNAPIEDQGLGSGLFDFRKVEKFKIPWALGSDIGGGPFLSMFDVMRSFVEQNRKKKIKQATFTKGLYRATLAGAEILGLSQRCGNLDPKKDANFIVVPLNKTLKGQSAEEILEKFIHAFRFKRASYDGLVSHTCYRGKFL